MFLWSWFFKKKEKGVCDRDTVWPFTVDFTDPWSALRHTRPHMEDQVRCRTEKEDQPELAKLAFFTCLVPRPWKPGLYSPDGKFQESSLGKLTWRKDENVSTQGPASEAHSLKVFSLALVPPTYMNGQPRVFKPLRTASVT